MKAADLEAYLEESRGLERDYLEELVRSRRAATCHSRGSKRADSLR